MQELGTVAATPCAAVRTADQREPAAICHPSPPARFYRPELDGLRFVAFFAVLIHHALPLRPDFWAFLGFEDWAASLIAAAIRAGAFGVDLFFVLSAFLITELLLREHEGRGCVDVKAFLTRRALRIWPLFFVFLAVSLAVDPMLHLSGLRGKHLAAFLALAGNWGCVLWGYPASTAAPLWSVSIEEQFYLAVPVLLRVAGPRRLGALGVALVGIAAASRAVTVLLGMKHPAIWCSTLCRVDTIGLGILVAVVLRRFPHWNPKRWVRVALACGSGVAWVAAELWLPVEAPTLASALLGYPAVALGAAALLLASLGTRETPLTSRAFVGLGRISYGLYVFHFMAIQLVFRAMTPRGWSGPVLVLVGSFAVTCVLASLSYVVVEKPFLLIKKRFTIVPSRD